MANLKQQAKEKEMAMSVSNVYLHVVEDVINNVRTDFQSEGVDDNVLNELQSLWELKLVQSGAIQESSAHEVPGNLVAKPISQAVATPVHDLNEPYVATEEYEAPSSDMPFSRVGGSTSTREPVMFQYMPPGPSEESLQLNSGHHHAARMGNGAPSTYMQQPAPWMNHKHRGVELNMNETYEEREEGDNGLAQVPGSAQAPITKDFLTISTGKRKHDEISSGYYIPQRDGADDDELSTSMGESSLVTDSEALRSWVTERSVGRSEDLRLWVQHRQNADAVIEQMIRARASQSLSVIPQVDGIDDEYDDAVAEDYNEPEEDDNPAPSAATPAANVEPTESEGSEPPLNEDDDDDDVDDADQGDEEPATNHLVLAQFDKVTRSKNKWKCTLKDGIMHLNNRDILFVKATGEFEF
jgi:transcription initiation factor TFIIA large subunit